eukprot:10800626-Lingulodinium_polyedra.AAC.1
MMHAAWQTLCPNCIPHPGQKPRVLLACLMRFAFGPRWLHRYHRRNRTPAANGRCRRRAAR